MVNAARIKHLNMGELQKFGIQLCHSICRWLLQVFITSSMWAMGMLARSRD